MHSALGNIGNEVAPMMDVHVTNKTYHKGAPSIIQNLDFEVKDGEFLAIVGPSGAGKSTLLNLIAGIDTKFEGHIRFNTLETRSSNLSIMFQEPRLMPWLNLQENVCLVSDSPKSTLAINRAAELLETVGITGSPEQYPGQLSGGMQRRVALARTLMADPDILLLDEPLVSLDQPAAMALRELLLRVWRARKCTVIYVTHQLEEAVVLADRILFLSTSPTSIIREEIIDLPRPRRTQDVDAVKHGICKRAGLLSGRLA
ncbi:ABC transporter ATP-binding protein [Zhongshania sp. BJYM1]|uniref:ABC transporter ATP-binding protein n=1 Tax=Zhongshania aquatica TaxID=2965069 RepID=UPI0022B507D6|nr:ABC transporter ATP-binding protein [Marortus sp. BJYM1]